MLTIYQSNRPVGGIPYGFVYIYDDGRYVTSFHGYDKSGESDEFDTALACFEEASEVLEKLGYKDGAPVSIVSKYAEYGYAIISDASWPDEEVGA
ncbi:hypothetical protein [Brevibacillus borstelensis]|uniref:hypothetical protein n=1 Tax=Brevibacillus borstelensis TaxID=45462 RepID=UPI0004682FBC|nr:hypothetical protein [Brevibacillus borstelensis]MCC0566548.1 hypothetical protein [Brevibacillus borstelensis]MCM3473056.1 hypothetical protein [Brevibacillus borstelensis]MCM3561682.1 hypothetical protein [Brevibacillus borstelensis]MED1852984.1 hypothetical protein [Brevibacillus borstelensis]